MILEFNFFLCLVFAKLFDKNNFLKVFLKKSMEYNKNITDCKEFKEG